MTQFVRTVEAAIQTCAATLMVADLRAGLDQSEDKLEVVPIHEVCFSQQVQVVLHNSLQMGYLMLISPIL